MELITRICKPVGERPRVRLHRKTEMSAGGFFTARKLVEQPPQLRDRIQRIPGEGYRQYVWWEVWGTVVNG